MRAFLCLFAVLFLFTSQTTLADKIYRWVDADNQVHFGSQPPAQNLQAEEVVLRIQQPSASAISNTKASADASSDVNGNSTKPSTTSPKKDAANGAKPAVAITPSIDPELAERNCRIAKEQKQNLSENFNRRFQQADGSYRQLTDAERTAKTQQMDEVIKQYCN